MMKTACHYAIIRFMPFVETEEFANVGVVLFSPKGRFFGYRLIANRYKRITDFFEQVEGSIYRALIRDVRAELERIQHAFKQLGADKRLRALDDVGSTSLWLELIKPRESLIRFSQGRVVLTDDPAKQLDTLFGYYVERNFVTREYREQRLEKNVRNVLRAASLADRFLPARVGNDEYHVNFPFVELVNAEPSKVIKPLSLTQTDPARIIDHGDQWLARIRNLRKRGLLPGRVLFAVDGQDNVETATGRARIAVLDELRAANIDVAPISAEDQLLDFAER